MRAWTVHLSPDARAPVLMREGFAFWAFVFGAFWLLAHRCWIAGLAALALTVALGWALGPWASLALNLLLGFHGRDLRRWTLERRGWRLAHVVLGDDEEAALARLLGREPALTARFA